MMPCGVWKAVAKAWGHPVGHRDELDVGLPPSGGVSVVPHRDELGPVGHRRRPDCEPRARAAFFEPYTGAVEVSQQVGQAAGVVLGAGSG